MRLGVIGLPNAGKSTLFNALTSAGAQTASYPFTTIDPNVGVATVPDARLDRIADIAGCERRVPAVVTFVDIAGLVRGANQGEGLGNQFLGHIRDVDAVAYCLRAFSGDDVPHVLGEVNPVVDVEILETELMLADLATVERAHEKLSRQAKSGDPLVKKQLAGLKHVKEVLERGVSARIHVSGLEEDALPEDLSLLSAKPAVFVANVDEDPALRPNLEPLREAAVERGGQLVVVSAKIQEEMSELDAAERAEFAAELGVEGALEGLIRACFLLLGLITFFSIESGECRAWPVRGGTHAPQAAGAIHTDMEKNFIKAEVVQCENLLADGSIAEARHHGHLLLEGREYVVKDGDVITFKFGR